MASWIKLPNYQIRETTTEHPPLTANINKL